MNSLYKLTLLVLLLLTGTGYSVHAYVQGLGGLPFESQGESRGGSLGNDAPEAVAPSGCDKVTGTFNRVGQVGPPICIRIGCADSREGPPRQSRLY